MLKAVIDPWGNPENVAVKVNPMPNHAARLQWTATGYGARLPTEYMVCVRNRWRRVYIRIFSNSGTLFIGQSLQKGKIVDIS